jgi:hypothetical protein
VRSPVLVWEVLVSNKRQHISEVRDITAVNNP